MFAFQSFKAAPTHRQPTANPPRPDLSTGYNPGHATDHHDYHPRERPGCGK